MNELRDFAEQDTTTTETVDAGYSKDGKQIVMNTATVTDIRRWGLWFDATGYSNSRNVGEGSLGIDYRIAPHLILGAYASFWHNQRGFGSGGAYAAFYERGWYAVLGGQFSENWYTGYFSAGYDFKFGNWLIGPVVSGQFDAVPVELGFGRGNLWQSRAGGRVAYRAGRLIPEVQVMYENQVLNPGIGRQNAIWFSAGVSYQISDRWNLFGYYSLDANESFQENQVDAGVRVSF